MAVRVHRPTVRAERRVLRLASAAVRRLPVCRRRVRVLSPIHAPVDRHHHPLLGALRGVPMSRGNMPRTPGGCRTRLQRHSCADGGPGRSGNAGRCNAARCRLPGQLWPPVDCRISGSQRARPLCSGHGYLTGVSYRGLPHPRSAGGRLRRFLQQGCLRSRRPAALPGADRSRRAKVARRQAGAGTARAAKLPRPSSSRPASCRRTRSHSRALPRGRVA